MVNYNCVYNRQKLKVLIKEAAAFSAERLKTVKAFKLRTELTARCTHFHHFWLAKSQTYGLPAPSCAVSVHIRVSSVRSASKIDHPRQFYELLNATNPFIQ